MTVFASGTVHSATVSSRCYHYVVIQEGQVDSRWLTAEEAARLAAQGFLLFRESARVTSSDGVSISRDAREREMTCG